MEKQVNLSKFVQLLEMASHEASNSNEAHSAARAAKNLLTQAGMSFANVRVRRDVSSLLNPSFGVSSTALLDKNAILEAQVVEAKDTIKKLQGELARLEVENNKLSHKRFKPRHDGSYTWEVFSTFTTARLRRLHGWRRVFADQYGIPEMQLANWQKSDSVPKDAFDFARERLRQEGLSVNQRQTWTFQEDDLVEALVQEGKTSEQISTILSDKLKRKEFGIGSIKKARQRNESRHFILKAYDAGERNLDILTADLRKETAAAKGHGGSTRLFVERVLMELRDLPDEFLSPQGLARRRRRNVSAA